MHGLRLFVIYMNYIVYCIVYKFVISELSVSITSLSFIPLHLAVSELAKCITCGGISLLYKNYIVYICVH